MRALAVDKFKDVTSINAGLVGGSSGDHGNHCSVAKALRNGGADACLAITLGGLKSLVLSRTQIAGVSVQRFQKSMQRAAGDRVDVWLLDILRTNPVQ